MEIRDAVESDARDLAYLINLAGEGLPEYLWQGMAEGNESPLEVGARRAARNKGNFSYTNARVCAEGGALLGMILAYRQPDPYEIGDLSEYPEAVRAAVLLEAKAPGSWYINAIATYEEHRGKGVARRLMEDTAARARSEGCELLSLIVASENTPAKRMYECMGFEAVDAVPVAPYPGCRHGGDWILMTRPVGASRRDIPDDRC
ncbi:MAG: GNAT family N-acetyltransferase [Arenicellales bacterium]